MAGQTSRLALPYPTGTDRVTDGDNAIQALAEALDFEGVRVGAACFPFPTQINAVRKPIMQTSCYDAPTNGASVLALTFPVPFTQVVLFFAATTFGGSVANPVVNNSVISLTGVSIYVHGAVSTLVRGTYIVIGI